MRISLRYLIAAAVLILINIVFYATRLGGDTVLIWISDLLPVICGILAVVGLAQAVAALKTWDTTKTAWFLMMVGMALSTLAELIYFITEIVIGIDPEDLGPFAADVFWLASYIPLLLSLFFLLRGYMKAGFPLGAFSRYIVGIIVGVAVAIAVIVLVLVPIFSDPELGLIAKIVYAYYPVGDMFLLAPAAILIIITAQFGKGLVSLPWKFIAAGFIGWAIADIGYSIFSWQGLYESGNFIDLGWNISYLTIGAAGLYQHALLRTK